MFKRWGLAVSILCFVGMCAEARAQNTAPDGWTVTVYPIFAWLPVEIGLNVDVSGGDGGSGISGEILDTRFDGAYFGGLSASNGPWRLEGYGLWAAFGGDRPDLPFLEVDVDVVYGDVRVGRRVAPDFFVTGGVRRVALKYDVTIGTLPRVSREPGVWDPIVGVGWHRVGQKVEWHASFDGGGFGVGSDVDLAAGAHVDWKPLRHLGIAAGYNVLYLKVTDDKADRTVVIKPTVHGPVVGIGLYF
jgi:hypothetical protein